MEIIIIALINLIVYFRTIFYDLVVDDIQLRKGYKGNKIFNKWDLRSLIQKCYGAGMFESIKLDHMFTVCLHTIICILIYITFGKTYVSFIASLLYSVCPINNQTAVWLNGRRYAVNTVLVLLIWLFKPLGFLLYPLIFMFQINAVPAILLLFYNPIFIPLVLVLIFILFYFKKNLTFLPIGLLRFSETIQKSEYGQIKWEKIIVMIKSYGYFVARTLFPYKIAHYTPFLQTFGTTQSGVKEAYSYNKEFWKGLVFVVLTGIVFFFVPQVRFYLFWYIIFIFPWLNLLTSTQFCADRYTAIANIGLLLTVAYFLSASPLLIGIYFGWYLLNTLIVQEMYKDLDTFYLYNLWTDPRSVLNICFYVRACTEQRFLFQAMTATMRGLLFNPKDYRLLLTKARLLHLLGYVKDKENTLKECYEELDDVIFMPREDLEKELNKLKG